MFNLIFVFKVTKIKPMKTPFQYLRTQGTQYICSLSCQLRKIVCELIGAESHKTLSPVFEYSVTNATTDNISLMQIKLNMASI